MNELRNELRNDESLTTADIANPERANGVQAATATIDDRNLQTERHNERAVSATQKTAETSDAPLFPDNELNDFRGRWDQVQASFVDEPRQAVEQADSLVANVVKRIAEQFSAERAQLEKQWDRGDNVSTEDLRQALRRYRSFFNRLLTF
jgi:hypothetical protein